MLIQRRRAHGPARDGILLHLGRKMHPALLRRALGGPVRRPVRRAVARHGAVRSTGHRVGAALGTRWRGTIHTRLAVGGIGAGRGHALAIGAQRPVVRARWLVVAVLPEPLLDGRRRHVCRPLKRSACVGPREPKRLLRSREARQVVAHKWVYLAGGIYMGAE